MNDSAKYRRPQLSLLVTLLALLAPGCAPAETADQAADTPAATAPASPEPVATAAEPLPELRTDEAGAVLVSQDEMMRLLDADSAPLILDVRTPEEYAEGHVPGAVNISHDELATRLAEIEAARQDGVIVYCRSGRRAATAEELLLGQGFQNVQHLEGDMIAWLDAARPVEKQQ